MPCEGTPGHAGSQRQLAEARGSGGTREHALRRLQQARRGGHRDLELFGLRRAHFSGHDFPQQAPHRGVAGCQLRQALEGSHHQSGCAQDAYAGGKMV